MESMAKSMKHEPHAGHHHAAAHGALAKDPVCGMSVDPATAKHRAEHHGQDYFFCSARCREKFLADPASYLPDARPVTPAPAGAIYVCPMHPEVRQDHPGPCPICGMAPELEMPTAAGAPVAERADMTRRFWIALVLTAPLVVIDMVGHVFDLHSVLSPGAKNWIELLLSTPVVLWAGAPFFIRAWASLVSRNLNMFTLIALGSGTAFAASLAAILVPTLFPSSFRDAHGS